LAALVVLSGCSTVVEDQQMPGMDLKRFTLGERRIDVIKTLGPPAVSAKDGANSCDLYRYAHTVSRAGQGVIDVGETAGNFFTFGLFGAMAMPAEDAMKGKRREAWFCYAADERLVSMTDQGPPRPGPEARK
jgi:hypothetical protein